MGLFRHSKKRQSADPLEDAAEGRARGRDGVLGPEVTSVAPIVKADPNQSDIAEEKLRASANPEDDTTRELLINRERRAEGRNK